MCDLSLSYLFQIYTATPLVFTHMYRVLISVSIKYLEWRCCEIELFKCTLISLWDLRTRRSNWAARLGASTRLLERHLLPTQILQKILKQSFQPRQLRDRRRKKNGRPHSRHWGFCPLLPLQAKCFCKAGAWRPQVDWWAKPERDKAKKQGGGWFSLLLWLQQSISPQNSSFIVPLMCICTPTDTEQEPADNSTKSKSSVNKKEKKKNLYTGCFVLFFCLLFRWFIVSLIVRFHKQKLQRASFASWIIVTFQLLFVHN